MCIRDRTRDVHFETETDERQIGLRDQDHPFEDVTEEEEEEPHQETQTPRLPIELASGGQSQGPRAQRPPLQNPWRHFSPPPMETGKGNGKIIFAQDHQTNDWDRLRLDAVDD